MGTSDNPEIRLRCQDSHSQPPLGTRYATLSHCWGDVMVIQLLRHNMDQYKARIPVHELPKTFYDAVLAARKLDIEYLWIDALCIVQDSEKDWLKEASRMDQVYSNSYLNLSASASPDGSGGLFRERDPLAFKPLFIRLKTSSNVSTGYACFVNSWADDVEHTPISHRAWVLQEHFFGPESGSFRLQAGVLGMRDPTDSRRTPALVSSFPGSFTGYANSEQFAERHDKQDDTPQSCV